MGFYILKEVSAGCGRWIARGKREICEVTLEAIAVYKRDYGGLI